MPLIKNHFVYRADELLLIETKKKEGFTHQDWSLEYFMPLRSRIRDFYRKEQKGNCAYCMQPISIQAAANAQVEHILPKSKHETFIFEVKNLCVICADCNQAKGAKNALNGEEIDTVQSKPRQYPSSSNRFLIIHPAIDTYSEHIAIKGKLYIDLTSKGHFTIGACNLNRFTHKFGIEQSMLDDYGIFQLLERYSTGGAQEKQCVFEKIRELRG
jgi:uncharacterized protein (TIGR02646 family)